MKTQNKAKTEFKIHLYTFLAVITLLIVINLTLTPEYFWAKWPMMGWGIAIIIQGIRTYYSGETNQK